MHMPTFRHSTDQPNAQLDLIAAQYVLGTLSYSARQRFQSLMQQQPALCQLTYAWERRLNPLASLVEPEIVPTHVWTQIDAKLNQLSVTTLHPPVVATRTDTKAHLVRAQTPRKAANDSFWKPWAWASTAIAASLVLLIGLKPQWMTDQQPAVVVQATPVASRDIAVLSDDKQQPAWIVRQQGDTLLLSQLHDYRVPSEHDLELWHIDVNAVPQSLGVLRLSQGTVVLSIEQSKKLSAQTVLAVSLEPKNGSPTGQPTGSILYSGKVV